jgi:hypothetical protein
VKGSGGPDHPEAIPSVPDRTDRTTCAIVVGALLPHSRVQVSFVSAQAIGIDAAALTDVTP